MQSSVIIGDCRQVLRKMPLSSVDSVVTDPPYELGFMGKGWDKSGVAYDVDLWRSVYAVLKPGGHLLAFGGTRTYHRLACAIEDAGFEIRDQIGWAYGSGFPKSHNLDGEWKGWGTALKPAWEPIVVARKPLIGTVAENVQRYGTGAINVDGCRVGTGTGNPKPEYSPNFGNAVFGKGMGGGAWENTSGRWPANLIHDGSDEVLALFPETAKSPPVGSMGGGSNSHAVFGKFAGKRHENGFGDSGSAARFFYCAKASKADREDGLRDGGVGALRAGGVGALRDGGRANTAPRANNHPTVKPTELMRYLCRLVTPPGGTVLDPFTGSGSTGRGAVLEGFNFIGIERDLEYAAIAEPRIAAVAGLF